MSTQSSRLRAWWTEMRDVLRTMGIASVAGFVVGTVLLGTLLRLAMFVASLAAFGYAVSVVAEWLLRVSWWRTSPAAWIVMGPLLLVTLGVAFPFGVPAIAVAAGVSVWRAGPALRARAPGRAMAWAGQIGVVAAIGLSAAFLAVDVAAVV